MIEEAHRHHPDNCASISIQRTSIKKLRRSGLSEAVERAGQGLIDADLGGGVYQAASGSTGAGEVRQLSGTGRLPCRTSRNVCVRLPQAPAGEYRAGRIED